MLLIERLKALDKDKAQLDELVQMSAESKAVAAEYSAYGLAAPTVLIEGQRVLATEIRRLAEDKIRKELREIEQAEAGLESAAEKRARLAERKAELQSKLAGAAV